MQRGQDAKERALVDGGTARADPAGLMPRPGVFEDARAVRPEPHLNSATR
ncbi:hypothetical protein GCM10009663_38240 [Kitasatospora arboriphila]|uniref:Uncharacterized protein n=1 Tax=Kitasatospora arboriphila TaxID=258052 RepID=A0ABN1TK32_9ACTN